MITTFGSRVTSGNPFDGEIDTNTDNNQSTISEAPDGSFDISEGSEGRGGGSTSVVLASADGGARVVVAGPGSAAAGSASAEPVIPPGLEGFFRNVLEIQNPKFVKRVVANLEKLGVERPSDFKVSQAATPRPTQTRPHVHACRQ